MNYLFPIWMFKNPANLIIHFLVGFALTAMWPKSWPVQIVYSFAMENEQYYQHGFDKKYTFGEYFLRESLPDLTCKFAGITFGYHWNKNRSK